MSEDGLPSRDEFLVTKEYRRFAEFLKAQGLIKTIPPLERYAIEVR